MRRGLAFICGGAVVVIAFAVWVALLLSEVADRRAALEQRIAWVSELSQIQAAQATGAPAGELEQRLTAVEMMLAHGRGADDHAVRLVHAQRDAARTSRIDVSSPIAVLRQENATTSRELGDYWTQLQIIALIAVTTTMVLTGVAGYVLAVLRPRIARDAARVAALVARTEETDARSRGLGHEVGGAMTAALTTMQVVRSNLRDGRGSLAESIAMLSEAIAAVQRAGGTLQDVRASGDHRLPSATARKTPAPAVVPVVVGPKVPAKTTIRVLLIDDDEFVLSSVRRVLGRDDVTTECDPIRGIELAIAGEFDVILCDMMMPGRTGADVYREVLAKRPELAQRFLFMSGGAVDREHAAFLDSAPARIDKPFGAQELRLEVARIANREPPDSSMAAARIPLD